MHFLISGIPASGKSTFCRWLEEKKGFLHLDVEKPGVLDRYGLATAWASLFDASTSAAPFLQALDRFNRPIAIDWGFPPEHVNAVRKLFDADVMLWGLPPTGLSRGANLNNVAISMCNTSTSR